jgi:hypothetical protein
MNDLRNSGNINAALAASSFNQHDRLVDEFLHRLYRLAGEEAPEALSDIYFNEQGVMDLLDSILEELPVFDPLDPLPSDLEPFYRQLVRATRAIKVEDHIAGRLIRQLHEENAARRPERSRSPPIEITDSDDGPSILARDDDDDMYADDDSDDGPEHTDGDVTCVEPDGPILTLDDVIDDEAEEMPEGHESDVGPSEEGSSGSELGSEDSEDTGSSEDTEVSDLESTPRPATPPPVTPLSLVDYPDDDED